MRPAKAGLQATLGESGSIVDFQNNPDLSSIYTQMHYITSSFREPYSDHSGSLTDSKLLVGSSCINVLFPVVHANQPPSDRAIACALARFHQPATCVHNTMGIPHRRSDFQPTMLSQGPLCKIREVLAGCKQQPGCDISITGPTHQSMRRPRPHSQFFKPQKPRDRRDIVMYLVVHRYRKEISMGKTSKRGNRVKKQQVRENWRGKSTDI